MRERVPSLERIRFTSNVLRYPEIQNSAFWIGPHHRDEVFVHPISGKNADPPGERKLTSVGIVNSVNILLFVQERLPKAPLAKSSGSLSRLASFDPGCKSFVENEPPAVTLETSNSRAQKSRIRSYL